MCIRDRFMYRMARKHGVRVTGISPACQASLLAHSWPGNVRELQNVIERAVILCGDGLDLQPDHLGFVPLTLGKGEAQPAIPANVTPFRAPEPLSSDKILPLQE